jgi:hypothetical protein
MRTFNVGASEVVSTSTGNGFRHCELKITLDDNGAIQSVVPFQEGYVEDAPQPEGS